MFSPKLFIENKGQFDNAPYLAGMQNILFAVNHSNTKIFFSNNKIAYTLHKKVRDEKIFREFQKEESKKHTSGSESEWEIEYEQELKSNVFKTQTEVVNMEWEGAHANCSIEAEDVAKEYFNYGRDKDIRDDINFVHGYKKITYKNLYDGIDVEYSFHSKTGIKYNIIVHPGADISKIKLKYSGGQSVSLDHEGNVIIKTSLGNIIDHAPISFQDKNGEKIKTKFILKSNTLGFQMDEYDRSQTLTIDPWLSSTLPQLDTAYEIAVDPAGNVFVYGDYNSQVKKYDNTGAPVWTFLAGPAWLYNATLIGGDLTVDPAGNSYCSGSECIQKLSPAGTSIWLYAPFRNITNISCCELGWRMVFDAANNRLYGGGSNGQTKATWYDPATGNPMWLPNGFNACNIIQGPCPSGCPNANGEIRHLTLAPNGNFYGYTAVGDGSTATSVSTITGFDPNFTGIYRSCNVPSSPYWIGGTYFVGAYYMGNGIAASNCYIYICTGNQVYKFDIYAPTLLGSATIANGSQYMNSGMLADLMNNFYVGTQTGISAYSPTFNLITSVATPKPVYDMAFAPGNNIAACGIGFVGVFANIVQTGAPITCNPSPNLPMTATADSLPGTGCSSNNGMAWVDTIMNGTGPYNYLWSTGATTDTIINLAPGNYTCTIIDASCPAETTTVFVTIPSSAGFSVTPAATANSCFGGTNGNASVNVTGGSFPYTYQWSPSGGNSSAATGLSAGNYTVTITDAGGCTKTQTVTVTQPSAINLTMSSTQSSCGSSNGTATVSASGGTPSYSYLWSNGQTTSAANNLSAGNYSVSITDGNGCTQTQTVAVNSSSGMTVSATSTQSSCTIANGTATANPSSGSPPYSYLWNNNQTTQTATGLSAGTYTVTVTDAAGCSAVTTATVTQPSTINSSAFAASDTCSQGVGTATANAAGGTTPYTYLWSNGQTTSAANNLSAGNYSVTVTDGNGCSAVSTVTVGNFGSITANAGVNVTILPGSSATLTASGGGNYSWNTGETTSSVIVSPVVTTSYTVMATNSSGCSAFAVVTVFVLEPLPDCDYAEDQLFVPDAFSPNGDTKNDVLGVYYPDVSCIKEFTFIIYDRWGEKVFEAEEMSVLWDGTYKGKMMNTAVFVYYMKVIFITGNETVRKGNVSLIR